jgi:proline iminopeptidase
VTLFHVTRGEGPTMFVLSSIGAGPYERMLPAELGVRQVIVELRGSGRSPGKPDELTFDLLADDLEALRAELGVEKVIAFGHSIAGMLALEYARRRPSSVSLVVAVGTPPSGDMTKLAPRAQAFYLADASDERKQLLAANLGRLSKTASAAEQMLAQTPARFFDPRTDAAPLFAESASPELTRHILTTLAPTWTATAPGVPVLLALGRCDYTVPHIVWDGIALDGVTTQLFEKSGHQPFFEEPALFRQILEAHVRQHHHG